MNRDRETQTPALRPDLHSARGAPPTGAERAHADRPRRLCAAALLFGLCLALSAPTPTLAADLSPQRADVQRFIERMASAHGFDRAELGRLLQRVILREPPAARKRRKARMTNPAESRPWAEYRAKHVLPGIIRNGVKFWRRHAADLARAEKAYGVPAHVIVAILGVETRYGGYQGDDPVLNALATFAFNYPRRQRFFTIQLEEFLLLAREEGRDPFSYLGSYAGAMGMPQFMPDNYRRLAVDFDGDGRRDIWQTPADAIGSIANYLRHHGWRAGAAIASPARIAAQQGAGEPAYRRYLLETLKPRFTVAELEAAGVRIADRRPAQEKGLLMELRGAQGREHWVGWHNFYVISRYNPRTLYTMAVFQLGEEIRAGYAARSDQ